jgi:hypothetical protein
LKIKGFFDFYTKKKPPNPERLFFNN